MNDDKSRRIPYLVSPLLMRSGTDNNTKCRPNRCFRTSMHAVVLQSRLSFVSRISKSNHFSKRYFFDLVKNVFVHSFVFWESRINVTCIDFFWQWDCQLIRSAWIECAPHESVTSRQRPSHFFIFLTGRWWPVMCVDSVLGFSTMFFLHRWSLHCGKWTHSLSFLYQTAITTTTTATFSI